jgi:hypothetical protein
MQLNNVGVKLLNPKLDSCFPKSGVEVRTSCIRQVHFDEVYLNLLC